MSDAIGCPGAVAEPRQRARARARERQGNNRALGPPTGQEARGVAPGKPTHPGVRTARDRIEAAAPRTASVANRGGADPPRRPWSDDLHGREPQPGHGPGEDPGETPQVPRGVGPPAGWVSSTRAGSVGSRGGALGSNRKTGYVLVMSRELHVLARAGLDLEPADRLDLASLLIDSVEEATDPGWEASWIQELARRTVAAEGRAVRGGPWAEVRARLLRDRSSP